MKTTPARKSILENEEISLFCTSFHVSVYLALRIKTDFFQKLKNKVNQAKNRSIRSSRKGQTSKKMISTAADVYFETVMDEITEKLDEAAYKLLD